MLKVIGIALLAGLLLGGGGMWWLRGREIAGLEESLAAAQERVDWYVAAHDGLAKANAVMEAQIRQLATESRASRADAETLRAELDAQAGEYEREIARILTEGRNVETDPADAARAGLKRLRCGFTAATAAC